MPMIFRLLVLLLALLGAIPGYAASHGIKPVRVLFIGNSYTYTNDLPRLVKQLASANRLAPVETEAVTSGGVSLKWHWEQRDAQAALGRKKWDYVVLQDFSTLPITDPATVQEYVRLFDDSIRSAGARTVLYLTWARAYAPQTQAALDRTYYDVAGQIGARVAPVGPAWALARQADPRLPLYESDNSHPTLLGSYLAAYVFHITLFGKAPDAAHVPQGLTRTQHLALLQAAMRATGQDRQPPREARPTTPAEALVQ